MDQLDTLLPSQQGQSDTDLTASDSLREVVLTYDPDTPAEVVLTYSADLPPAMCPPTEPPPPATYAGGPRVRAGSRDRREPRRRKKKRTLLILLLCVVAVTGIILGVNFAFRMITVQSSDDYYNYNDGWIYSDSDTPLETTIASYPTGGDARVVPLEDHGDALTAQEVYEKVNPSVVAVVSYAKLGASAGTGVIMSSDGYVITNYHVVEGGMECDVLFYNGAQFEARLVGYDRENDLAVLKIAADGLPAAEFGSSDMLTVGDKAYAIGNPLGLELRGTLTDGIISAINRDVEVEGETMTLIQTNAALNSGNSGGPLINQYGQVVGINTIKMVASYDDDAAVEGLGFAIPSSTVAHIVNCLISTGEVTEQPVLGITVQGMAVLPDGTSGVLVIEVTPGLGGEIAGVQEGDIIVAADGEPIVSSNDVLRVRRRYTTGDNLPMTIYRDGQYMEVEVPLMEPLE